MEILEKNLNEDMVYYIKKHTVQDIKNDADVLFQSFIDTRHTPIEPSGGKQYNVWLQYMLMYTKNIKPLEEEFRKLHKEISESNDFDTLQTLYPKIMDTYDSWYDKKKRYQFSGYYTYE